MRRILILLLVFSYPLFAQGKTDANIFGHVVSNGEHLIGVNIMVKGTNIGTANDRTGHYKLINLPLGKQVIRASFLGYKTKEIEVFLEKGVTIEVNFELEEEPISTGDIVVSANRVETNRKDAPLVVKVMSPELFTKTNSYALADGLSFQPGLRLETNCQNCGFQQVKINGLEGAYSQILIDSRPIFSALNGVYGLEQIPTSMIDRVEVIRGGGSAIFGSNAIAGTINIITKEPLSNSFELSNNSSLIDGKTNDNNFSVNGAIITDDRNSGMFIFGNYRKRDHYDANGDGFSEIPEISNKSFGIRGNHRLSPYTQITLEYHNLNEFRRGGNKFDLQPHETEITEQIEHDINSGALNFTTFSEDYKSRFSSYLALQKTKRKSYYGMDKDINAYGNTKDFSTIIGGQYSIDFDELLFAPSTLTSGLEYNYNDVNDFMPGYNRNFSQSTNTFGLFLQNEWRSNGYGFLVGFRADKHNLVDNLIISPRLNFLYHFTPEMQGRISYSKGFRAPQAFDEDLHLEFLGGEVAFIRLADDLKTESSNSVSASLDFDLKLGKIFSNFLIEGFYTKLNDVFKVEPAGIDANGHLIFERRNGEGAKVYGVNFESKFALSNNYQVQWGFTLQKSEYDDLLFWSNDNDIAPVKQILRTPDFYGFFTLDLKPFKTNSFSLSGVYTGSMYLPHFAGNIEKDILHKSKSFFDANIRFSQDIDLQNELKLKLSIGVNNIFNSYQSDFDKGITRDSKYIYGPAKPRTFSVGLTIGNLL